MRVVAVARELMAERQVVLVAVVLAAKVALLRRSQEQQTLAAAAVVDMQLAALLAVQEFVLYVICHQYSVEAEERLLLQAVIFITPSHLRVLTLHKEEISWVILQK